MEKKEEVQSFLDKYLTPIAVLVGALIIAGAFMYGGGGGTAQQGQQKPKAVDVAKIDIKNDPFVGEVSAPVTIVYWFDYQCPFCKKFDEDALAQVYENYVKTGKVKIVFKDFQFLGPDSTDAGLFAQAVWEAYPEEFYAWHQAMFAAQDEEHGGFGNTDSIVALTKTEVPAIDTARILSLIESKKTEYEAALDADRAAGSAMGVNGTPALAVGKAILSGAQPYATVSAAIEAELK